MKIHIFFSISLLLIIISSCSTEQTQSEHNEYHADNISISYLSSFKLSPPDSINIGLLRAYRTTSTKDGKELVFQDITTQKILFFNRDGKLTRWHGGLGRGPKEFIESSNFNVDEAGNLFVYDQGLMLLKSFTSEGSLLKTHELEGERKDHVIDSFRFFVADDKIYAAIAETEYVRFFRDDNEHRILESSLFVEYNTEGDVIRYFGRYDPAHEDFMVTMEKPYLTYSKYDNAIYSTHHNLYQIQKTDIASGKVMEQFGVKPPSWKVTSLTELPQSREEFQDFSLTQSTTNDIYVSESYVYHYFFNATEDYYELQDPRLAKHYLAVYDRANHEFIQEIKLPYPLMYIFERELFLFSDDNPDNFTVEIYELS
jgi:hypothetical protein